MKLSIIVAIGKNNEIGKSNQLLWSLPDDLKHFRSTTNGHTIIMGRKTFESIGRILPNRTNIIITRDANFVAHGAVIVHSFEEALEKAKESGTDEAFIIGGGQLYSETLPLADKLYITHVDTTFPDADVFFPEMNCDEWNMTSTESHTKDENHPYDFRFATYERI